MALCAAKKVEVRLVELRLELIEETLVQGTPEVEERREAFSGLRQTGSESLPAR